MEAETNNALVTIDQAVTRRIYILGQEVLVHKAPENSLIDITDDLAHPDHFHGDPHVDMVIQFGDLFASLVGEDTKEWDPKALEREGIHVLADFDNRASELMATISQLAKLIISDASAYDIPAIQQAYYDYANAAYSMLSKQYGPLPGYVSASLIRAGAVSLRLALGMGVNANIPTEVPIITKRLQLKRDRRLQLSVSVKYNLNQLRKLHGQDVNLVDFVNPASGASTGAAVVAGMEFGIKPRVIHHRSVCLTTQGVRLIKNILGDVGIYTTFTSLGRSSVMDENYYLAGDVLVADAGHILRNYVPDFYK